MLNYQSLSFHDIAYLRNSFGLRAAPEFEEWLTKIGVVGQNGQLIENAGYALEYLGGTQ